MKIEFPVLESEPLIYFLLHSGVFVIALGVLFFILGLSLGRVLWGRVKHEDQLLRAQTENQRREIEELQRQLAASIVRPITAPLPPMETPVITATLPAVEPHQAPPPQPPAPVRVVETVPAMPELADVGQAEEPPSAPRPKRTLATSFRQPHPLVSDSPSIAPFSFLMEEPEPEAVEIAAKST